MFACNQVQLAPLPLSLVVQSRTAEQLLASTRWAPYGWGVDPSTPQPNPLLRTGRPFVHKLQGLRGMQDIKRKHPAGGSLTEDREVSIYPSQRSWHDFGGHDTHFSYRIKPLPRIRNYVCACVCVFDACTQIYCDNQSCDCTSLIPVHIHVIQVHSYTNMLLVASLRVLLAVIRQE